MSALLDFFIPTDVRAVRDSLDCDDAWSPTYLHEGILTYLTHVETGLHVWCRNRPYGLEIYNRNGVSLWGGVSAFSSFGLSPGHWSLLFAIKRWERKHPMPHNAPARMSAAQLLRGGK